MVLRRLACVNTATRCRYQPPIRDVARWLHKHKRWTMKRLMRWAVEGGFLGAAQWCHEQGRAITAVSAFLAAQHKHREMLLWMKEMGFRMNRGVYDAVLRTGDLDYICWAEDNLVDSPDLKQSVFFNEQVLLGGNQEAVDYALRKNGELGLGKNAARTAALAGNVRMVEALWGPKEYTDLVAYSATEGGHLDVLDWIYEHRPNEIDWEYVIYGAIRFFRMNVLTWVEERNPAFFWEKRDYGGWCVQNAIEQGNLEMLQWLVAHGAEIGELDHQRSVEAVNSQVQEWIEKTTPYRASPDALLRKALDSGDAKGVRLALNAGAGWSDWKAAGPVSRGHLHVLKVIRQRGYSVGIMATREAMICGQVEILKWFDATGTAIFLDCDWCITGEGDVQFVEWACKRSRTSGIPVRASWIVDLCAGGYFHLVQRVLGLCDFPRWFLEDLPDKINAALAREPFSLDRRSVENFNEFLQAYAGDRVPKMTPVRCPPFS